MNPLYLDTIEVDVSYEDDWDENTPVSIQKPTLVLPLVDLEKLIAACQGSEL